MQAKNRDCLGFTISVMVYASVAELDTDAGRQGATLDIANDNLYLRGGTAQDCREAVADFVETHTKVPRKTRVIMTDEKVDGKPTGKKVPLLDKEGNEQVEYDETEADYVTRALAAKDIKPETIQPLLDQYLKDNNITIAVSAKLRERKPPQPKKLAKEWLTYAEEAIKGGKVEAFGREFKKLIKRDLKAEAITPGEGQAQAFGWEIKFFFDEKARLDKEKVLGALVG